ncbi:MAG TPA: hypothetical protein VM509_00860 [Planctomycetota bacterium]|nr:hypothetical protein [Planctomycetota bacterium]
MRRLLPAFVQRRLLLSAARRALAGGRPEAALVILGDELLREDPRAASLRTLVTPLVPGPPPPPPLQPNVAPAREELRKLLEQMRAEHPHGKAATADGAARPGADASSGSAAQVARPVRLRMSLDDAGSFLVAAGTRAVVGHSRAGEADVPILADLLPRHARFVLVPPSFHAGAGWRIEPLGAARVQVGERVVDKDGCLLAPGARVVLGENVALRFEQPDSASLSCALELEGGSEAAGARRILLFAPGAEGRLRIGARGTRHVQATALGGVDLELVHDGTSLRVLCASGLIPDEAQGSAPLTECTLPLRLARPVHLRLCMPTPSERPRWISFAPLEDA